MNNGSSHKKCEFIIRQFMGLDDCPPELSARFHEWLFDGRDCREKDEAIRKLFEEALDKKEAEEE